VVTDRGLSIGEIFGIQRGLGFLSELSNVESGEKRWEE